MTPKVLIISTLFWAEAECRALLEDKAEILWMESNSRQELFDDFKSGGRYSDITAIYHEHLSAPVIGHPDAQFFDALPSSCKWLAHKGAGYDSVDVQAARKRDVGVSNTPEAVNEATATTALYLLLATVRRFTRAEVLLREGGFSPLPEIENAAHDLSGRMIGILGMGGIGRGIVSYIRPFGMKMVYHNRSQSSLAPPDVTYCSDMYEMLRQVDILMISVPLNEKTRGMIGSKEMNSMKKGSIIINTARGPIVNEEDLINALETGQIGAVGLDVFTKEPKVDERLIQFPQATLLPHVGTENQDARRKMEVRGLTNLRDFLVEGQGKDMVN